MPCKQYNDYSKMKTSSIPVEFIKNHGNARKLHCKADRNDMILSHVNMPEKLVNSFACATCPKNHIKQYSHTLRNIINHEQLHDAENQENRRQTIRIRPDIRPDIRTRLECINVRIVENICVICQNHTDNYVQDSCNSNCGYYCHDKCAGRWIATRFDNYRPYCMVCGINHQIEQIPFVVTNDGLIQASLEMAQEELLDLNNLGPQFLEYLEYRGIEIN